MDVGFIQDRSTDLVRTLCGDCAACVCRLERRLATSAFSETRGRRRIVVIASSIKGFTMPQTAAPRTISTCQTTPGSGRKAHCFTGRTEELASR
jgi:hypothetical protein